MYGGKEGLGGEEKYKVTTKSCRMSWIIMSSPSGGESDRENVNQKILLMRKGQRIAKLQMQEESVRH